MSKRIPKSSGVVEGVCGLTLEFKQWHNGQNLFCEEEDVGVTSYPRQPLRDAISRFCHTCRNNPHVIQSSSRKVRK